MLHRLLCRQVPRPIWPQVVATEHYMVERQTTLLGNAVDKLPEVTGPHPGVTACLVDLVRRRLDQDMPPDSRA